MPLKYLAKSDNIHYQCLARGGTKLMRVYYNVCVLMIEYYNYNACDQSSPKKTGPSHLQL